jgi:hypothetical protein
MPERFPAVRAPSPAHEVERARVGGVGSVARQGESAVRSGCKISREGKDLRVAVAGPLLVTLPWEGNGALRHHSGGGGGRNRAQIAGEARGQRNRRRSCQTAGAHCMWPEQRSAGGGSSSDKQRRATEHATTRTQVRERAHHKGTSNSSIILPPLIKFAIPC